MKLKGHSITAQTDRKRQTKMISKLLNFLQQKSKRVNNLEMTNETCMSYPVIHRAGCGRERRSRGSERCRLTSEWAMVCTAWRMTTGRMPPASHVRLRHDRWHSPPEPGSSCIPRKRLTAPCPTEQFISMSLQLLTRARKRVGKTETVWVKIKTKNPSRSAPLHHAH